MALLDILLVLLSFTSTALAQTWTDCQPLNKTCPPDTALGTNATFNFTQNTAAAAVWNTTAGPIQYTDQGCVFEIQDDDMSPTIQSKFYIFFGRVETIMQAAEGQGIVSSVVLQSDDLDEIDWEFVGSNSSSVQSNFYGKGNTTTYGRAVYHDLDSPQNHFYNYTTVWTAEKLEWHINGKLARTLPYDDPLALGGRNYPQTPMTVRMGAWPAGKKGGNKYTIQWAGGNTDFSKGQSYKMIVQSLKVQDYSSGKEYTYSDTSGDWQSIKVASGNSSIAENIWKPHGVKGHWDALPKAAQIAIVCAAIGVGVVLLAILTFCCIKQRRAGRRERAIADAEFEKGAAELMDYRRKMSEGGFASGGYGGSTNYMSPTSDRAPEVPKLPQVSIMDTGRPMKSGWL
ncbi:cell wall glucanase [Rhizodiscina lignyota]|uniref:chitinase n=1 Tax=Rhizodiscina lignyota TaxID=1504668 RepID=A0A9P4M9L8_9PEZI|nr:cell wall glucanase [Rhizodiscina lignyota]